MNYITATRIFQYIQCPHWPYYDWHATDTERALKRKVSDGEIKRWEDGVTLEEGYVKELSRGEDIVDISIYTNAEEAYRKTIQAMEDGVPWIYQGTLIVEDLLGKPDLLYRIPGTSILGNYTYIPIDIKSSHSLQKYQKLQLSFYAYLIEKNIGGEMTAASIVNANKVHIGFDPRLVRTEMLDIVETLRDIRNGKKPACVLRKNCSNIGVWGAVCEADAKAKNDIALLYNVDVKRLAILRELGIHTVYDAARMNPKELEGIAKGLTLHGLEVIKLQAESILHEKVIIREAVSLIPQGIEIHFDIETDPPNDYDYLYGILIRDAKGDTYRAFVARGEGGEKKMWNEFLTWIGSLPLSYTVYHFSPYEKTRLSAMEARYGIDERLDVFRARMVDIKESVRHTITLPLYFYGLKNILKFLGFTWRSQVQSGGGSIDRYEEYIQTGDEKILDDIILYNEDDVRATAFLRDWITKYAGFVTTYVKPYPWES